MLTRLLSERQLSSGAPAAAVLLRQMTNGPASLELTQREARPRKGQAEVRGIASMPASPAWYFRVPCLCLVARPSKLDLTMIMYAEQL